MRRPHSAKAMTEFKPPDPKADIGAWCQLLGLVRDEAKDAGEDFLAYLTGVALSHASTLVPREKKPTATIVSLVRPDGTDP
jgi:hypothetical protein